MECKQSDIVFEINSAYHQNIYPQLKEILRKYNPLVIFGSDAHDKKNIAKWLLDEGFTNEKN
jgi:histidinol phosphatase-like PHP family hydrolase